MSGSRQKMMKSVAYRVWRVLVMHDVGSPLLEEASFWQRFDDEGQSWDALEYKIP